MTIDWLENMRMWIAQTQKRELSDVTDAECEAMHAAEAKREAESRPAPTQRKCVTFDFEVGYDGEGQDKPWATLAQVIAWANENGLDPEDVTFAPGCGCCGHAYAVGLERLK